MRIFEIYLLSVVLALSVLTGCNNESLVNLNDSKDGVEVSFNISVNAGKKQTRAAADLTDIDKEKFVVVAYALGSDGNYTYEAVTESESNSIQTIESGDGFELSNKDFLLPIGSYRFLVLYNVGGNTEFTYYKDEAAKSWNDILGQAKISRTDADTQLDVNEIFAYSSGEDVNLSDQTGKINVEVELDRINSRIDVLVKKIYKKTDTVNGQLTEVDVEVGYKDGNDVLDGASNIQSVTTEVDKYVNSWSLSKVSTYSSGDIKFDDNNANITVGTSDDPTGDINAGLVNNDDIASLIKKGSCYYKGAYILPFVGSDATNVSGDITKLSITFKQNDAVGGKTRTINVENVKAQENYISLITVKLITTKDPGEGGNDGDDGENIFNPSVEYTITIDKLWGGVHDTPVEI